jgi:hypothetical protein
MWLGQDDTVQGLDCPAGTCVGADGNLYEWVSGVDGLGNPIGFWKRLRRGLRRLAPIARRFAPLIPAGAAAAAAWRLARPYVRRAAPYFAPPVAPVPVAVPVAPMAPEPTAPPMVPMEPTMAPAPEAPVEAGTTAGWGLGAEDLTQVMGIGYVGEVAEGPDGGLYQWVQGVDGLGNPFGFWKRLKRGLRRVTRRLLPLAQRIAPFVPGGAAALTVATPFLKQAGVAGYDGLGALYQAPDGAVYQVQGFEADDDLNGFGQDDALRGLSDEELQGLADDEELRGFSDDEELRGLAQDDELRGLAQEDELRGFGQDDELRGFSDEDLQGFADEDVQGMEGYLRQNGVSGFDAFVPDAPRETPWFKAPGQPPPLWSPLW